VLRGRVVHGELKFDGERWVKTLGGGMAGTVLDVFFIVSNIFHVMLCTGCHID
jgi:hypothetical protein